jgi:hypothetical protein
MGRPKSVGQRLYQKFETQPPLDRAFTAIIQADEDYVPEYVQLRARVSRTMFTANVPDRSAVDALEEDPRVKVVAPRQPIRPV